MNDILTDMLASHAATESATMQAASHARRVFADNLTRNAPLHITSHHALRAYETDPSIWHHHEYRAAWLALSATAAETGHLLAQRTNAMAEHATASYRLNTIRRLRQASTDVTALGYDPKTLL